MSFDYSKNKGFTFGYNSSTFTNEIEVSGPGPGSYNLNDSYESLHGSTKKTIGKGKRFNPKMNKNENNCMAPGLYHPQPPKLKLPNITFTKSQRKPLNPTNLTPLGPGSYEPEKFWTPRNNALPFISIENEEFLRVLHTENTPGPGSYDWKKDSYNGASVIYNVNPAKKLKIKSPQNEEVPGPGKYDPQPQAILIQKSISFPKADKTSFLESVMTETNIAPNTYVVDPKIFDYIGKAKREITYSFSQSKRMPSLHRNLHASKTESLPPTENQNRQGHTFYKAKRIIKLGMTEQSEYPGPGEYDLENYWEDIAKAPDGVKQKMNQIVKKLKQKSTTPQKSMEFLKEKKKNSIKRKTSLKKRLQPFLRVITQTSEAMQRKSQETLTPGRRKGLNNPLKSYILKKIQKNVEKKLEKKINKEIFLMSNEAAKKRKNKGFTTSSRKYEFLNIQSSPAPNKYEIKRDLNSSVLPLPISKKITIFEQENDVPAPNSYNVNIDSPFTKRKKEKNKTLIHALRKIEDINKHKKLSKIFVKN